MIAGLAADLIVIVHLLFILFVALGGILVVRWQNLAFLHLPCALWGVLIACGGWICPLTPLEMHFRQLAGQAGYTGGFVDHYLMPIVYPDGLTRGMQIAIGVTLLLVNLLVYARVAANRAKRKKDEADT